MAKYIELIDKYLIVQSEDTDYNPPSYEWVDNTGEIVRCKDCKHWECDAVFKDGWCRGKHQGNPNWFCADGEKREES